ncbi:hypothetical protein [Bradyrhizobium sp. MOS003]|uniref:hypothetical protein n=1 Tax=Bradyrhizobium sp. MOS003 TaxID=2133946 RepID=UPI0011BED2BA|nr:hypothetical protein [Bradyrhizobium sp. MOS003]
MVVGRRCGRSQNQRHRDGGNYPERQRCGFGLEISELGHLGSGGPGFGRVGLDEKIHDYFLELKSLRGMQIFCSLSRAVLSPPAVVLLQPFANCIAAFSRFASMLATD